MYDSRIDRRKPGRDLLDPELENMFASSLIAGEHPRRYMDAAYQVETACMIAGALLLLVSLSGSSSWTNIVPENVGTVLMTAVLGVVLALVGALTTLMSRLWLKRAPTA
jgi:hypothetical protein